MSGGGSAPASAGNLGPGFDCLALAFELRCRVTATPADGWELEEDGRVTRAREGDLVIRAVSGVVDRPMRLRIDNDIPRSRGLGSSSAVTTAAAVAALRALDRAVDHEELFALITDLEGHADNAAAAVYGGLVLTDSAGRWRHLEVAPQLRFLAAVPDYPLATHRARAALPTAVRHVAAARSLARVGFLIEGLRTGDAAALGAAGGDEMHEAPRAELSPLTGELITTARDAGAMHAAWSGAGPTALAICAPEAVATVTAALEDRLGDGGGVVELDVATDGFR